jgi:methylphosphotriester-DNA--protein-cysteine methyltransferase
MIWVEEKKGNHMVAQRDMEGALFKKVDTTALFCRPNKRSPDEPSETEVNADISSFQ